MARKIITSSRINPQGSSDLEGFYDAPLLKPTGVIPGNYTNLNATVDKKGRITKAANGSTSGSGNAVQIQGEPVSAATPSLNETLIWNGSEYVPAPQGTSFSFGISSFTDSYSSPLLIGSGVWQAIGALSFSANYSNGPATSGTVAMSGAGNTWSPNSLTMTSSYDGPTATTQVIDYPASPDTAITFTLSAAGAAGSSSRTITHEFENLAYWGASSVASGYTAANITGLSSNGLQNTRDGTINVTPTSSQYIIYAHPTRYGTASFTVNGFTGGFGSPSVVSITNAAGYTENYNVYRSTNVNLGATTVVIT